MFSLLCRCSLSTIPGFGLPRSTVRGSFLLVNVSFSLFQLGSTRLDLEHFFGPHMANYPQCSMVPDPRVSCHKPLSYPLSVLYLRSLILRVHDLLSDRPIWSLTMSFCATIRLYNPFSSQMDLTILQLYHGPPHWVRV